MGYWGQDGFDVRLEWGREGVETLGAACAVLVIVDVLSFSTTVDLIVSRGGRALGRVPRPAQAMRRRSPRRGSDRRGAKP
ncbi:hypothetical protein AB5J62_09210 [Amycolatopsis sp. cg5]|uniref:hypothetical protein n=1 Tax=Amycolatopsis sp. cg5 TaxID=3238802 RepID=UPI00352470CD